MGINTRVWYYDSERGSSEYRKLPTCVLIPITSSFIRYFLDFQTFTFNRFVVVDIKDSPKTT